MTKRVILDEVPYKGIEVGEKVVFLATSFGNTYVGSGFYRGLNFSTPVVEYFHKKKKWYWDKEKMRYFQDKNFTIVSRRVYLALGRVWSAKTIKEDVIDPTPSYEDLLELKD